MSLSLAVYTVATRSHLHRARTLMASVQAQVPEAERWVVLADSPGKFFDPAREPFRILAPEQFGFAGYRALAFALDAGTLCCALKPLAARFVRARSTATRLLYLDSDTLLLARPDAILQVLDQHSLVLTPHFLYPERNQPANASTVRSGAYNAGVFALGADEESDRFLAWWEANSLVPGFLAANWGHDQCWLNHAPALFPGTGLLRHPGYNVAFWNLHERAVSRSNQGWTVEGMPLVVFHFSYFDRQQPGRLVGPHTFAGVAPTSPVLAIATEYAAQLSAHGADTCERWPYEYGSFSNGAPVRPIHRAYFAQRLFGALPAGADPFDVRLTVPGLCGLKSVYRADHPLTRSIRLLRELMSPSRATPK
jgi:hypothetical protein